MVSLLCGLFVFLVTLLALSAAANNSRYDHLTTRCIGSHIYDYKKISNDTVHLVHGSDPWRRDQVAVLEGVLQNYDASKVHLVLVCNAKSDELPEVPEDNAVLSTTKTTMKRARKKREKLSKKIKPLKAKTEPRRKKRSAAQRTLQDVLLTYPDIIVETVNYTEAFKNSPLYNTWHNLNEKTRIFAIRTIFLWQYGGISFDLLEENYKDLSRFNYDIFKNKTKAAAETKGNKTATVGDVVELGLIAFRELPKGIVTIDDKGWHMESRTSCHAFFGDMLMNIRKADQETMPEHIIKRTLNIFCKRGSIDSGYCSTVQR